MLAYAFWYWNWSDPTDKYWVLKLSCKFICYLRDGWEYVASVYSVHHCSADGTTSNPLSWSFEPETTSPKVVCRLILWLIVIFKIWEIIVLSMNLLHRWVIRKPIPYICIRKVEWGKGANLRSLFISEILLIHSEGISRYIITDHHASIAPFLQTYS